MSENPCLYFQIEHDIICMLSVYNGYRDTGYTHEQAVERLAVNAYCTELDRELPESYHTVLESVYNSIPSQLKEIQHV